MALVPNFSTEQIQAFLAQHYQLSGSLTQLMGYCDQNLKLTTKDDIKYVVKIANAAENINDIAMQNCAMTHLYQQNLPVPQAIKNTQQQRYTIIKQDNNQFCLRLLNYLPGVFYSDTEPKSHNQVLWHNMGSFMGTLNAALLTFSHTSAYRFLEWDLSHGYRVCMTKKADLTEEHLSLVEPVLLHYRTETLPMISQLPKGVIHNDANDHNLLVDNKHTPKAIAGIIDFGDMVHSELVNELAITCAYAMMNQDQPIDTLCVITAGYHQHRPLSGNELDVLLSLICLRLCTTLCNSASALKQQPNNEYLLISVSPAINLLKRLSTANHFAVSCQLRTACGLAIESGKKKIDIELYRQQHLSKNLSLAYHQPLKIVRGQGAYLFDEQGNQYLDMVNNVCHVGHCHPKVVQAGQNQMAKLNTNTRYLHDNIIEFSEKLLATMPEPLSVCMFVNSGSEANELAFRLASNFTQSKQLMVVDGAYHGNTGACINASPYKFNGPGGQGKPNHVHITSLPDVYRGKYIVSETMSQAQCTRNYVNDAKQCIEQLQDSGKKLGAFICESLQGVAGQIIMPQGYLSQSYQLVRAAGGVCIADEVQVGFGRIGQHMWAFQSQCVVPDIVTLGKPIGNGHPLAAVVTTKEIADAFVNGMEYFNTFGGNPVSCAIGSAVLDVISEEQLQSHALTAGQYFQAKLKQLQQQHDIIGDVRGLGLFIGVELVTNNTDKSPATKLAQWFTEYFKQHGILLTTEGPFHNIFKIKPPLAISTQDIDYFLKIFQQGLTTPFAQKLIQ